MADVTARRMALQTMGYAPIPVAGKRALLPGWQTKHAASAEEVAEWAAHADWSNTGILTRTTPVVDYDILHPEAAAAAWEITRDWFDGKGLVIARTGQAPKLAIPFRTDTPFRKIVKNLVAPDGGRHKIEVLCDGQQVVVDGVHPDTNHPYIWHGGYTPWAIPRQDLPELTEAEARSLVEYVIEALAERFDLRETPPDEPAGTTWDPNSGPLDVDACLANMDPSGAGVNDVQPRVILSLLQKGVHPDDVLSQVVEATMSTCADLNWTREEEIRRVTARVRSGLNKLHKEYDRTTGTIPTWLAGEFHAAWAEALVQGRQPELVRNGSGWYVRSYAPGRATATATPNVHLRVVDGVDVGEPATGQIEDQEAPRNYRFRLYSFAELRPGMSQQEWLVEELIPREGLVVLYGKYKSLKSFLVYGIMFHVAHGMEYRDRAVQQGLVAYCAFEGAHGYGKRTEALRRHYGLSDTSDVPLYVMAAPVNLVRDHVRLAVEIRAQLNGKVPCAVVLDTLNRSLHGSESKDVDMAAYIAAATSIREAFRCVVIIIHHCGWDESRPRGHSSLPGAVETMLAVSRDGDVVTLRVECMRDGPEDIEIVSTLKKVVVGTDPAGKEIDSLVIVPFEGATSGEARKRWPQSLSEFRGALNDALRAHGEPFRVTDPFPGQVRAVDLEEVRTKFYERHVAKGDTEAKRQDARKHAFQRGIKLAQRDGLVKVLVDVKGCITRVWYGQPEDASGAGGFM